MKKDLKEYKKLSLLEVQNLLKELMREVDAFCRNNNINYYIIGGTLLGAVRHNGFIPWDDDIDIGMLRDDYEIFLNISSNFSDFYEVKNYRNSKNCDHPITRIYIPDTYIDNSALEKTRVDRRLYFDIFPIDKTPETVTEKEKHANILRKMKNLLWWSIPYQYSNNIIKRFIRKIISILLSPFKNTIIKKIDKSMKKYNDIHMSDVCSMASQYSYQKQTMDFEIYGKPIEYCFEDLYLKGPADSDAYLKQLFGADYMQLPPLEKRRKGFDIYVKYDKRK